MAAEPFTRREQRALARLDSPGRIQAFLDSIAYSTEEIYRSPRRVLRDRVAHCFDGGLFAAAALRRLGHPPLIVDMKAENDDTHLLAVFKRRGRWGAVAKSNCTGLRFREPVYRSLRELVMSYFDLYFNILGQKTLRGYTVPLDLRCFDHLHWMTREAPLEAIAEKADRIRTFRLITPAMTRELLPVDERMYRAGLMGANPAGLFHVAPAPRGADPALARTCGYQNRGGP